MRLLAWLGFLTMGLWATTVLFSLPLDLLQTWVNLGVSRQFDSFSPDRPLTVGFNVVNLLDNCYLLRSGSGVGDFAPQYGPRRGFYLTLSQKL